MLFIGRFMFFACGALLLVAAPVFAADTLKIGIVAILAGDNELEEVNGAKLAVEQINKAGGVLGREVELVVEDSQLGEAGAVSAFSKLAPKPEIIAVIGPDASFRVHAMAPDILKTGKPVLFGGADPKLTHMGNPWLFRFRPNDTYSTRVMTEFGVNTLSKRKWAIVHATEAFGTSARNALVENLKSLNLEPVVVQGYPLKTQDFSTFLQNVKGADVDIVASYTFPEDHAALAKQMRQTGIDAAWIASPSITTNLVLHLASSALNGVYAVADFAEKSNPAAEAFAQKYKAAYNTQPDVFSAWTFDAMTILAKAVNDAKSIEPDKIRSAILAVRGYEGAEGTYDFDQNGDGLHGYNIVHNDNGTWVFDRHIEFKD